MFEGYKQESGTVAVVPEGLPEPAEVATILVTETRESVTHSLRLIKLRQSETSSLSFAFTGKRRTFLQLQDSGAEVTFGIE